MSENRFEDGFKTPEKASPELFVHDPNHTFKEGDEVIDVTAERLGLPDVKGKVVTVDGSGVEVEYLSGEKRWKKHINLRKVDDEKSASESHAE